MAHAHNLPKSEQKPEFTDYLSAGYTVRSLAMRECYDAKQLQIFNDRLLRLDNRFWDTRLKPHPVKIRSGFPTKRDIDYSLPSKKGQPKALNQFKVVNKIVYVLGEVVHRIKIFQLHATRGWKAYA